MARQEIIVTTYINNKLEGILIPSDATRQTLLCEEVDALLAALTVRGMSPEYITTLLEKPAIKCLLPG